MQIVAGLLAHLHSHDNEEQRVDIDKVRVLAEAYCRLHKWRTKTPEFPEFLVEEDGDVKVVGTAASLLSLVACIPALLPELFMFPKRLRKGGALRCWAILCLQMREQIGLCFGSVVKRDALPRIEELCSKIMRKLHRLRPRAAIPKLHYFLHLPLMIQRYVAIMSNL